MSCEEALILISGYLDGTNTEEETTRLRSHLECCPDCRQVLRTLEEIDYGVVALKEEPPADLKDAVMNAIRAEAKPRRKSRRWIPIAAAAALMLVVGMSQLEPQKAEQVAAPAALTDTAVYSRALMDAPAAVYESRSVQQVNSQQLADRLGADIAETGDLLPEMEVCPCETLEDGSLLYRLESAGTAAVLSEAYGLELFRPADGVKSEVSYARLIS